MTHSSPPAIADRVRGCLLGGAVGDALGAGIEFMTLDQIRGRFGPAGVTGYVPAYGRTGAFTDDTQMTLFTVEGLLAARAGADPAPEIRQAYLRWLHTQQHRPSPQDTGLLARAEMWHRRAPGNTCVSALAAGGTGTVDRAINDSKGCGGVMRVAPLGFLGDAGFDAAVAAAALTHGHPSGYLAAGALAEIVARLAAGDSLQQSVESARERTHRCPGSDEVVAQLERASAAAAEGSPSAERVEQLGGGWVAEEALGIAVYCSLAAPDFASAVLLAVNHGGDSDSTGSLTGQVLGTRDGAGVIPPEWIAGIEAGDLIEQLAARLTERVAHT